MKNKLWNFLTLLAITHCSEVSAKSDIYGDESLHAQEEQILKIGQDYASANSASIQNLRTRLNKIVDQITNPNALSTLAFWSQNNSSRGIKCSETVFVLVSSRCLERLGNMKGQAALNALLEYRKISRLGASSSEEFFMALSQLKQARIISLDHYCDLDFPQKDFAPPLKVEIASFVANCRRLVWNSWISKIEPSRKALEYSVCFSIRENSELKIQSIEIAYPERITNRERQFQENRIEKILKSLRFPRPPKSLPSEVKIKAHFK